MVDKREKIRLTFSRFFDILSVHQLCWLCNSKMASWGGVRSTPFQNGAGFTLKTHQMFSLHTTSENLKNATITGRFGFVFEEKKLGQGYRIIIVRSSFQKAPFLKIFPSILKRKAGVFKSLRFEERAPFSWQISVDGRPNLRNNPHNVDCFWVDRPLNVLGLFFFTQAQQTRDYLKSVKQDQVMLPDGPLLLSPESLIKAFHRWNNYNIWRRCKKIGNATF